MLLKKNETKQQPIMKTNIKKNQGSLEKWLVPRLRQKIYKMSIDHFAIPESTQVPENKQLPSPQHRWGCARDTGANWKSFEWPKVE